MVDLQTEESFNTLGVELVSIAADPVFAWESETADDDISWPLVSDEDTQVSSQYGVMQWAHGGEPGHTFVLVGRDGTVAWIRDYGATENGGLMYVSPDELIPELQKALP